MPILHKFQNYDFGNGFRTNDSILSEIPYEPEVLFIGTFNHGWPWNPADFYYGRNMYMWTALANLFIHNHTHLKNRRTVENDTPTLSEILQICKKAKITFADLVKGTKPHIPILIDNNKKQVKVNSDYIWASYSDKYLNHLGKNENLADNVYAIIKYIKETPSLKHIYFTLKPTGWLRNKEEMIRKNARRNVKFGNIFTPTANGFRKNLATPYDSKVCSLTHCWIWNGLPHSIPINKPNYSHLDHDWLSSKGVNIRNF